MAETAKILNPDKKVLLPDLQADCSLAASCQATDLAELKAKHPDHMVVSYINCNAAVKTLSDLICTSGNALKLINSLPKDKKIIFAPDKNLGAYINEMTGRDMLLWDGACHVHNQLHAQKVIDLKLQHPEAKVIAHPECHNAILKLADFVGSTAAMLDFVGKDDSQAFVVATESGIVYQMEKKHPNKKFFVVPRLESCACNECEYMKMNTIEKLYNCLLNEKPEIELPPAVIEKAKAPILAMLEMS